MKPEDDLDVVCLNHDMAYPEFSDWVNFFDKDKIGNQFTWDSNLAREGKELAHANMFNGNIDGYIQGETVFLGGVIFSIWSGFRYTHAVGADYSLSLSILRGVGVKF